MPGMPGKSSRKTDVDILFGRFRFFVAFCRSGLRTVRFQLSVKILSRRLKREKAGKIFPAFFLCFIFDKLAKPV
jgi:hypothetical protein